jgi:predicted nucleotidyltransferase
MTPKVLLDQARIAEFCRRWKVVELSLFGSVLREDFRPDSDVDVLVEFEPGASVEFIDLEDMAAELAALVGRPVDVVTKKWLKPRVRDEVLNSSMVVYAA